MQGVVQRIYAKEFDNGTAYSFTLSGDRTFYRAGNKKPTFAEGDSVKFDVEMKGQNAHARGVSPWTPGDIRHAVPAAAVASSGPRTADDFWRRKEQRDVETQKRIELQSCRNSAIAFIAELVKAEAVKLPAKQADKVGVIEELVKHYTRWFLDENANGPEKDLGKDSVDKDAAVSAVDTNNNEKGNDDNWN